jgi:hypothetical protein
MVLQFGEKMRALDSCPTPLRNDGLIFFKGDIIEAMRLVDDNWWLWGKLNNNTGAVPVNSLVKWLTFQGNFTVSEHAYNRNQSNFRHVEQVH